MTPEEALKKIDELANILAIEVPDNIKIHNIVYNIKEDISNEKRELMLLKYSKLYDAVRREIENMKNVSDEAVEKAIILRRVMIFLRDYRSKSEIDDQKRWLEYTKQVGP